MEQIFAVEAAAVDCRLTISCSNVLHESMDYTSLCRPCCITNEMCGVRQRLLAAMVLLACDKSP
jgi:hypothetical protein